MTPVKNQDLALAIKSVQAAQSRLETELVELASVEQIKGREWKIRADRELETEILTTLQTGSDYPILSEESGSLVGAGKRQWIVDPLDGSANFSRDVPFFCISVGLWEDDKSVLSLRGADSHAQPVVVDPTSGDGLSLKQPRSTDMLEGVGQKP